MHAGRSKMKTSTLPPLRVSPELRAEAEAVLATGESLSGFVHDAVVRTIEFRKAQRSFVERGLASSEQARQTGRYVSRAASLKSLKRQVAVARKRANP
jgi:hypothetical protein